MKAKVAVATVLGKAYFLLLNELKEKNIDFLSLIPGEPVPAEAKVLITTEKEKHLIQHPNMLIFDVDKEPGPIVREAMRILQGIESYEKIVIGVDPGEMFGLAVITNGKVVETVNCFNIKEIEEEIKNILNNVDAKSTAVYVKIGNGVPLYKEVLAALDKTLPHEVILEVVSEAGTDKVESKYKHRRGFRHMAAATRIAARVGHTYQRGKQTYYTVDA